MAQLSVTCNDRDTVWLSLWKCVEVLFIKRAIFLLQFHQNIVLAHHLPANLLLKCLIVGGGSFGFFDARLLAGVARDQRDYQNPKSGSWCLCSSLAKNTASREVWCAMRTTGAST